MVFVCAVGLSGLLSIGARTETAREQIAFVIRAGAFVFVAARLVRQGRISSCA
jgi:hypothetical protein